MPYVKYSREAKAEAIALARVVGVAQASEQLGIDARAISSWLGAAGLSAGDSAIDTDELARFERLAYARLESELVSGKIKGRTLITSWGVVKDKLIRRAREPAVVDERTPGDHVLDRIETWITDHHGAHEIDRSLQLMLREFDVDDDVPAKDDGIVEGQQDAAFAMYVEMLEAHPDLDAWAAEQSARRLERDTVLVAFMAESHARYLMPTNPALTPELAALLGEADQLLQEMTP